MCDPFVQQMVQIEMIKQPKIMYFKNVSLEPSSGKHTYAS